MANATIIIPTYHRPSELRDCIASLLKQTRLPDELIVIDDGALEGIPLSDSIRTKGISCIYKRKDTPGLTASRNLGVSLATSDIVFFLDDDVTLEKGYVESIMTVFETWHGPTLAGVGGVISNFPPPSLLHHIRRLLDRLFLVTGTIEGRVLPSGFCTNFGSTGRPPDRLTPVDFLAGGVCAYARWVFDEFSFSEAYTGYGLGEDKDFSYRVSRQFLLVVEPKARLQHHESPQMRYDKRRNGRELIRYRYRFFRDHVQKGRLDWVLFIYAVVGYTFVRILIASAKFEKSEWQRIAGILEGARDIATGRADQLLKN